MSLLIALDYDATYTADPRLWSMFTTCAQSLGHAVICVTGRSQPIDFRHDPPLPQGMPIVYAGSAYKRKAAERAGHQVDIWIDDMPEMIGESRILKFGGWD